MSQDSAAKSWEEPNVLNEQEQAFLDNLISQEQQKSSTISTKIINAITSSLDHIASYKKPMQTRFKKIADNIYAGYLFTIHDKLIKDIKYKESLESKLTEIEKEVSDAVTEDYLVEGVMPKGSISLKSMKTFLFSPKGRTILEKIHQHYLIHYYFLLYGGYKTQRNWKLVYEDSNIPMMITEHAPQSDKNKMKIFRYYAVAYFIQALCYDETKHFDLMLNEFTGNTAANDQKLAQLKTHLCDKGIEPNPRSKTFATLGEKYRGKTGEEPVLTLLKKRKRSRSSRSSKGGKRRTRRQR